MLHALGKQSLGRFQSQTGYTSDILRNEALVGRLTKQHTLDAHNGCVNTVEWNDQGNLLLTGSDDHCISMWRWPSEGPEGDSKFPVSSHR